MVTVSVTDLVPTSHVFVGKVISKIVAASLYDPPAQVKSKSFTFPIVIKLPVSKSVILTVSGVVFP